jgi:SAM-dependent methyltransferase
VSVSSSSSRDDLWEHYAQWWIDGFTEGADPEYVEQIIPLAIEELSGYQRVVDVGTGDGQIARVLSSLGATVIGLDPTHAQITVAAARGGGPSYLQGSAHEMPLADESADAVLACLVFEHIDDMDAAISEVARVLRPGGRFSFFLNHPLLQTPDSGWIDDHMVDPPEQYWRIGPYLVETATVEEVEKDVFIRFVHRPLSRYVNALIAHGLRIDRMFEPSPPEGFLARAPEYQLAHTIPRLLYLRATKTDSGNVE